MGRSVIRLGCTSFLIVMLGLLFTTPAQAQDAASVYKSKCVMCHAADGSSDSPAGKAMKAADLRSDAVQKLTDAQLTDSLTNGKNKMPGYKDKLTADQIKALVGYIRTLAKK